MSLKFNKPGRKKFDITKVTGSEYPDIKKKYGEEAIDNPAKFCEVNM